MNVIDQQEHIRTHGTHNQQIIAAETLELIKQLEVQLAALSWAQWIPVGERLPEERRDVLLLEYDDTCTIGRWNEAVEKWDIKYTIYQFYRTYFKCWMPLPPAQATAQDTDVPV